MFKFGNTTKILPEVKNLIVLSGDSGHNGLKRKEVFSMKKFNKINGFNRKNRSYVTKGMGYKFEVDER